MIFTKLCPNSFQTMFPKTMKTKNQTAGTRALGLVLGALMLGPVPLGAQSFDVGSNGSLGDVVISENTTLDLPADGKLHYKSLTVDSGVRLNFKRNIRNTPVVILAQGDIVVNGIIDVNGGDGTTTRGGHPGPGGFGGGQPGFGTTSPGEGYGPGGGALGNVGTCDFSFRNGNGSFGSRGNSARSGATYGNTFLIPLIGGSGGAGGTGSPGTGGSGGGGAVLVASNTKVTVSGALVAQGGIDNGCAGGGGSGGAIRLVALRVEGKGLLDARSRGSGGLGRIRVDTLERDGIAFNFQGVSSVGGNLFSLPTSIPRLDTIEVAGTAFPEGSQPGTILLPFGSTPERTVKIQARDFGKVVPVRLTLTPDTGAKVVVDAEVDNSTVNPAVVEVPVTFPVNSKVTVHCWTR
jgi:hypothetical protein